MTESKSDDSFQDFSVGESKERQEMGITPGLAVLIAIIVAFVLLVIITVTFYWLKKIHGEKSSQVNFMSDYNNSFQNIAMSGYKKTASQVIMITAPGGETFQADQDGDTDYDLRDFMSVKDVDISRYRSSQDIASLNTFRTCSSVEDDKSLSLCSEITNNSRECQQEEESVNPTPAIKFHFEKEENRVLPSVKDALPSNLTPGIRRNGTLERGSEF